MSGSHTVKSSCAAAVARGRRPAAGRESGESTEHAYRRVRADIYREHVRPRRATERRTWRNSSVSARGGSRSALESTIRPPGVPLAPTRRRRRPRAGQSHVEPGLSRRWRTLGCTLREAAGSDRPFGCRCSAGEASFVAEIAPLSATQVARPGQPADPTQQPNPKSTILKLGPQFPQPSPRPPFFHTPSSFARRRKYF